MSEDEKENIHKNVVNVGKDGREKPNRGKFVRKEHTPQKNSIDSIQVVGLDENHLDIKCRFNKIGKKSVFKTVRIPLPNQEKIRDKIRVENPGVSEEDLDSKTEDWFNSYVLRQLKSFYKKERTKKLNIKPPSEIRFSGESK